MTKRITIYYPFIKTVIKNVTRDFTSMGSLLFLILLSLILSGSLEELLFLISGLFTLELMCALLKLLLFKHRPEQESFTNLIEKLYAASFPSSHAARSTFIFTYFAAVFWGTYKSYIFILIVILVSLTRVMLKKHYYIDVLAGVVIGAIFMYLYNLANY